MTICFEQPPHFHQREHAFVFDLLRNMGHQDIVIDPTKELPDRITRTNGDRNNMATGCFDGLTERFCPDGSRNFSPRQRIEHRCELLQQRLLDQTIHDAG
jgi:hypothetical protein